MLILLDCDIISIFAKIGRLDLLVKLFKNHVLAISHAVELELKRAANSGFDYLTDVKKYEIKTLSLKDQSDLQFKSDILNDGTVQEGEVECMVLAKNASAIFVTCDHLAQEKCRSLGIDYLSLTDILRGLHIQNIMPKNELLQLIKEIEVKDGTVIKNKKEILQ